MRSVCSSKVFFDFSGRSFVPRPLLPHFGTKYLFLHPFSAAGILCNISKYLLVLFTALSGMIVAWFALEVNADLWARTARCSTAAPPKRNPKQNKKTRSICFRSFVLVEISGIEPLTS